MIITIETSEKNIDIDQLMLMDTNYQEFKSLGFDGNSLLIYFFSIGGGVLFTELARIIINLIKRNDVKSVKINDIEIKGYSAEEVKSIINTVKNNEE